MFKVDSTLEQILDAILRRFQSIQDPRVAQILRRRSTTSSLLKGRLAYALHDGLNGPLDERSKTRLCAAIEIFCSAFMILDNLIDGHTVRNDKTTYLQEFGPEVNAVASHYAVHIGLRDLLPFLSDQMNYSLEQVLIGMLELDHTQTTDAEGHLQTLGRTNGHFGAVPLEIAAWASSASNEQVVRIREFGFNWGVAMGIYEEIRDLFGVHGRRRCTELESGRFPLVLHRARESSARFVPEDWAGKPLSDSKLDDLYAELYTCGAFAATAGNVRSYLATARRAIMPVVDEDCFAFLGGHLTEVEEALDEMLVSNDPRTSGGAADRPKSNKD